MIRVPRRPAARLAWWVPLLALVLLLAACTGGSGGSGSGSGSNGGSGGEKDADAPAASVDVQPAKDTSNVAPAAPVVVTAKDGTLTGVKGAADTGEIQGRFDAGKATWTSAEKLQFGTTYTVTATAANPAGKATTATS